MCVALQSVIKYIYICITKFQNINYKGYQEIKLKRYLNLQKHSFHSKEYEVMVPVSKGPVVLRRKQVI